MSSHECPCPNTWVIFYFRRETGGGHWTLEIRSKGMFLLVKSYDIAVFTFTSGSAMWWERYQAELGGTEDWGEVEQLQQGSVPLRFPRGQLFSRSFPCFPSALRQSRHSLRTFRHHLDQWDWRLLTGPESYYKAITTPPPPPPPRHLSSPATRSPLICQ